MYNVTIGRYYPGTSVIHHLSPLVKLVVAFLFFLLIWLIQSPLLILFLSIEIGIIMIFSKIPSSLYLRMLKGTIPLLIGYNLINLIFGASLSFVFMMNVRVLLSLFLSSIFLFTTKPFAFTHALDQILSPLKKFHIPVSYITFSILLVFRFLPLIMETMNSLMKALQSAGCSLYESSWKEKLIYLKKMLVPLFYLSFRKSDSFAELLEVKSFDLNGTRSYYHEIPFRWYDGVLIGLMLVQFLSFLFVR